MMINLIFLYLFIISPKTDSLLVNGLNFCYVENYDSAGYYFNEMVEEEPRNPAGYFMQTGLLLFYMTDYEVEDSLQKFFQMVDSTIRVCERFRNGTKDTSLIAWSYFFEGGSYLYRGFWYGRKGNYIVAVKDAKKAIDYMKKAVNMDSTVYDAYLGTGGIHYFYYRLKKIMSLGLADANNNGIDEIKLAVERSKFSSVVATDVLVIILGEEKRFNEAWQIIDSLRNKYPTSRTFQWAAVKLAESQKNPIICIKEYIKLFRMIEKTQPESYYNLMFVALKIAEWSKKAHNDALKERYKNYIIDNKDWVKKDKRLKKFVKKARRL